MDSKIAELLNKQINEELYSAYLYMNFANYFDDQDLDGYANWYLIQAAEERDHALIIRRYLLDSGEKVTLGAIAQPDTDYSSYLEPLEAGLAHEKHITACINEIYSQAQALNDYRTCKFLDWFIEEQAEEEVNAQEMVAKMKLFGNEMRALYDLNREYATRVYSVPSPLVQN